MIKKAISLILVFLILFSSFGITATSFVEYWQFTRRGNNWVLNKILQKNESDQIPFND